MTCVAQAEPGSALVLKCSMDVSCDGLVVRIQRSRACASLIAVMNVACRLQLPKALEQPRDLGKRQQDLSQEPAAATPPDGMFTDGSFMMRAPKGPGGGLGMLPSFLVCMPCRMLGKHWYADAVNESLMKLSKATTCRSSCLRKILRPVTGVAAVGQYL